MSTAVSLTASPTEQATSARRVPVNGPFDRIRQIGDAIAHRVYELFQKRGGASGCDQEDWAERELLHALHYTIFEMDSALMIFAEVPGFRADNLKGTWTHDDPITFERATSFGLPVRSNIPAEFLDLISLYPQASAAPAGTGISTRVAPPPKCSTTTGVTSHVGSSAGDTHRKAPLRIHPARAD